MDYSNIYMQVEKSIVQVLCGRIDKDSLQMDSSGTGFIIDDGKKVLTCKHCVDKMKDNVIKVNDDLILVNNISLSHDKDLAILEFNQVIGMPLTLLKNNTLKIGNEIFTVGYPYTFNSNKTLVVGNVATFESGLIKIDCSVNNGNSGGPLFNINGEVVGVISTKLGRFSQYLESVMNAKQQVSINVGGIDPVETIQKLIKEMQQNLNLGIGYAIKSDDVISDFGIINNIK